MRLSVRRTSTRIFRWTDAPVGKRKIPVPSLRRRDFFAVAGEGRRLFAGGGGLQREGMLNPAGGMARRDGPEQGAEKGPHRSRNADAESRRRRRDAGGGEMQAAARCRRRRDAGGGEMQAAARCRWRGDAGGGEMQVAGRCRWRGDAGGGEVGQETEWRGGIRSGGRGGLKGTGGGFGWKRRRIREKAARTERRRL